MEATMQPRVVFLLCGLVVFFILLLSAAADGDNTTLDCDSQVNGLTQNCIPAVLIGTRPSSKCCKFVRVAEPDCICPKISGDVTKVLKLSTALKIAKSCKRELPHNYQCGSYTLP